MAKPFIGWKCPECGYKFEDFRWFVEHVEDHSRQKRVKEPVVSIEEKWGDCRVVCV